MNRIGILACLLVSCGFVHAQQTASRPGDGKPDRAMELFLSGDYEGVLRSVSDDTADYQRLMVKCRAARELFDVYFLSDNLRNRTATPAEEKEIVRLSRQCDLAHEAAYRKAVGQYQKSVVLSHWWSAGTQPRYAADSPLLLEALREYIKSRSAATQAASRPGGANEAFVKDVAKDVRDLLTDGEQFAKTPAEVKDLYVRIIAEQFAALSPDDLPADRKAAVRRSLPLFVNAYINVKSPPSEQHVRDTMRWHVWMALTVPEPGEQEAKLIKSQMEDYAAKMAETFDGIFDHPLLELVGKEYADKLRDLHEVCFDNVLVPGFKQAIPEYEWKTSMAEVDKDIKKFRQSWLEQVAFAEKQTAGKPAETSKRLKELQKGYAFQLYGIMIYPMLRRDMPSASVQLPLQRIVGASGSLSEDFLYPFSISRVDDVPASKPASASSTNPTGTSGR